MDISTVKAAIVEKVEDRCDEWFSIAKCFYDSPEVGLQEVRAAAVLTAKLETEGFEVRRGLAGLTTAFRAEWGSAGPTIALLAEMDALPGLGHACGHNIIAAATLGAAVTLRHVLPTNAARIVVIGTPAEEQGIGKIELIRAGCFADVDFAMMVHPASKRQVIKMFLGLARIRFEFIGKAAHAAAHPEEGINALDAVIQTFNAINGLRQHLRQDVKVHGIITEGGSAPNIIPERASCFFYVRAEDLSQVEEVRRRIKACAEGAAMACGCRLSVQEDPRVLAPMVINRAFYRLYSKQLEYLELPEANAPIDRNMGSSDIGNVSRLVPTIHPHVPIGTGISIHTEEFARATVSEQGRAAVIEGAKSLALTAFELASCPRVREEILKEFTAH
ncbi:M20 family metallopeptidase [Geobacter sp. DSM 9736]|uniref:M20 family metallopeptidase n=1 Tax=Geobacter sp. DSM 9736 TaxID=1277350 RepID=UPI000B4FF95E|nr:M20 family metallopeptidase [Geobacter sp. DSM 9736]